jgi:hypothetical protein
MLVSSQVLVLLVLQITESPRQVEIAVDPPLRINRGPCLQNSLSLRGQVGLVIDRHRDGLPIASKDAPGVSCVCNVEPVVLYEKHIRSTSLAFHCFLTRNVRNARIRFYSEINIAIDTRFCTSENQRSLNGGLLVRKFLGNLDQLFFARGGTQHLIYLQKCVLQPQLIILHFVVLRISKQILEISFRKFGHLHTSMPVENREESCSCIESWIADMCIFLVKGLEIRSGEE